MSVQSHQIRAAATAHATATPCCCHRRPPSPRPHRMFVWRCTFALTCPPPPPRSDLAAVLSAARFSPAPRSGLSLHLDTMRACTRLGTGCSPHSCVAYTSTGCGGRFPPTLLQPEGTPSRAGRYGPLSRRCALHREKRGAVSKVRTDPGAAPAGKFAN